MREDSQDHPAVKISDGAEATFPTAEVRAQRHAKYLDWAKRVALTRPMGHETVVTQAMPLNWTPITKPLSQSTVALVSTGGVHLHDQPPFDVYEEAGDWSSRQIPGDVDTADLTVTHTHYATTDALEDINVMFPLDRLRELAAEGVVGQVSPTHFGFMGFIPDPGLLIRETVPAVAQKLKNCDVDVVVLSPG